MLLIGEEMKTEKRLIFDRRKARDKALNKLCNKGYRCGFVEGYGPGSYDAYTRDGMYHLTYEPFTTAQHNKRLQRTGAAEA